MFRASLQAYFIVTSVVIAGSHGIANLWSERVWELYGLALPLTILAILLGNRLAKRVPSDQLERLIDIVVVLLGITLII